MGAESWWPTYSVDLFGPHREEPGWRFVRELDWRDWSLGASLSFGPVWFGADIEIGPLWLGVFFVREEGAGDAE